jgi:CDGSH-type Zn-finger protein
MASCKCGLSNSYPECDGSHKAIANNELLRKSIIEAYKKWELDNQDAV